jgi:hypothetical protein
MQVHGIAMLMRSPQRPAAPLSSLTTAMLKPCLHSFCELCCAGRCADKTQALTRVSHVLPSTRQTPLPRSAALRLVSMCPSMSVSVQKAAKASFQLLYQLRTMSSMQPKTTTWSFAMEHGLGLQAQEPNPSPHVRVLATGCKFSVDDRTHHVSTIDTSLVCCI